MKEKFLVLEIMPKVTNGLFLSVDDDRKIVFEDFTANINLKKYFTFSNSPTRSLAQKAWEGEHIFKARRKVIAVADPKVATTIPIPIELHRDASGAKIKITVAEVENLVAQEMQKIFNGCRAEAAKRIGLHELDTVLVSAKAKQFKVDGKAVEAPAGFTGKKITLLLELTFTSRELFVDLKQFFNSPDEFFFAEAPQVHLAALSRVRSLPLNLVMAGDENATLFIFEKAQDEYGVLYREALNWSWRSLFQKIIEEFGVTEKTAKELYQVYRKKGMSESAERGFKKSIQPAVDAFMEEMGKSKIKGFVYIDAAHEMPFDLPHKHGASTFEEHPVGEILGELGFSVDFKSLPGDPATVIRPLLYFVEAYFDKSGSNINQKLRRRLHWLTN